MEERLKSGDTLTDEERLKLQLFSKDAAEVAAAHNKLVDMAVDKATAPLIPKAEFCDAVAASENSISFGKFAGEFQNGSGKSFGRNRIMAFCRNKGYLCKDTHLLNKPMQRMIDSGYMQYLVSTRRNGANKIYTTYTPMLTGKGQIWLLAYSLLSIKSYLSPNHLNIYIISQTLQIPVNNPILSEMVHNIQSSTGNCASI